MSLIEIKCGCETDLSICMCPSVVFITESLFGYFTRLQIPVRTKSVSLQLVIVQMVVDSANVMIPTRF